VSGSNPEVELFTDGACSGNPGPGGWGAILRMGEKERELSGGDPATTNNRMELMAAIMGLESLKRPCAVRLFTDSTYVSRGLNYGLAEWRDNNWQWERHGSMVPVKNSDLWKRLDRTLQIHQVECRLRKSEPDCNENSSLARGSSASQRQEAAA